MAHKIAVVMGSSRGIGKAIVIAFAKSNKYSGIVTNARKIEDAQTVSDEINRMGCETVAVEAGLKVVLYNQFTNLYNDDDI
jgi:NAD(P)-dependent dehydrogenase (short-subunit alcohol dehydrogenase family)